MIAVGVDTHKERHCAVALDALGQVLGELAFAATARRLCRAAAMGREPLATSTSSCSASREPAAGAPDSASTCNTPATPSSRSNVRGGRERRAGKSDRIDALAAAKQVLVGEKVSTPRRRGILSALRALLNARRSADRGTHAAAQPAPGAQRDRPGRAARTRSATAPASSSSGALLSMRCAGQRRHRRTRRLRRHARPRGPLTRTRRRRQTLRTAARRARPLARPTRSSTSPGSGRSQPRSCSPATPPASSTKQPSPAATEPPRCPPPRARPSDTASTAAATARSTTRSTRSRVIRAKHQPETRAYLDRRISEGKTKREALRALKRHISRELFKRLADRPLDFIEASVTDPDHALAVPGEATLQDPDEFPGAVCRRPSSPPDSSRYASEARAPGTRIHTVRVDG